MGNWGLKVSPPGVDVKTAEDKDLVFKSSLDQFKVKTNATATTAGSNLTIAHGVSYNPIFFGLFSRDNARFKMGFGGIDATNIILNHLGVTTYWRYYILYHTGV